MSLTRSPVDSDSALVSATMRRWFAAVKPELASATADLTLARSRPSRTWPKTSWPSRKTIRTLSANVEPTTRNMMDRRQAVPDRFTQRPTVRMTACRHPAALACNGMAAAVRSTVISRSPDHVPNSGGSRLVADASHSHDDLGPLRVTLNFRPQPLHVHVDQAGVGRMPVAPDLLEQHLAGEHLPGLAGEGDQKVELQRRERDGSAVALHGVPRHIDGEIADLEGLRRRLFSAPQPSPDPRHELLGLERLDDVVVGARLEADNNVDRVGLCRQHHDG